MGRLAVWLWWISAVAAPAVTKVDPPNWWVGHSYDTVRLLLLGSGLKEAQVKGERGLEILETRATETGTYLFVDVKPHRAGSYTLKVTTPEGSTTAPFEVLTALPPEGRYQGFSSNDLICLIMPDRFANGDPSYDDPPFRRAFSTAASRALNTAAISRGSSIISVI